MATRLPVFVVEPRHTYLVTWGDRQLRVTLTWRDRPGGWYLDLHDEAAGPGVDGRGVPVVLGRRVSPGASPLAGLALGDATSRNALVVVDGPDPYQRVDLDPSAGVAGVRILLVTPDEVAAAQAVADADDPHDDLAVGP